MSEKENQQAEKPQDRVKRIQLYIQSERQDLLKGIDQEIQDFSIKRRANLNGEEDQETNNECFQLYFKTCQNLMESLFPLLSDENYISLQSEEDVKQKIVDLKAAVKKSLKTVQERITMGESQWRKKNQVIQGQKMNRKKGKNAKIPVEASEIFMAWLTKNFKNPYPSNSDKEALAQQSGLSVGQVNNWFINARERVIKKYLRKEPKKEENKRLFGEEEENSP